MKKKNEYASCFGDLDTVFPMGEDELRHTPPSCFSCQDKTECLRYALKQRSGIRVKEELVDRAYTSGRVSFLQRWAQRKAFHNKRIKMRKSECNKEEGV
jgi:hypothetical protein